VTPSEKLEYIETQIKELRRGLTRSIKCPYCTSVNVEDTDACCATFKLAIMAILDREDAQDGLEVARQDITQRLC
jgi:cytochrome c-type biogenesis protein CcmH/NrfF